MIDDEAVSSKHAGHSLAAGAVFDALDQPVILFAEDGTYRYINAAGLTRLGMTESAVLGRRYLDLFPDLERHPFHAAFHRVASGRASLERLEAHDIEAKLWWSQRIHRAGAYIVVLLEDITARKQTERRLEEATARAEESERLFRTMIEGMPQLAWTAKADGFIDYYNPRWYAFTGTTPEQMAGWGWQSVHDPTVLPVVMERWPHSIATGQPFEMEFPLRRHDGTYRWFLTRVAPVLDESGEVVRWVGINTDIDEQKRAIRELDETLESMGDAFMLLDREFRLLRVNQRQEQVAQLPREESLGRTFWDVFPEARDPSLRYWTEYHRAMESRTAVHFTEYYQPLGVWTENDAFPTRDGGLAIFFRDITARKRAEHALSEERAVLDAVFRAAPIGLALFDEEFRYLRLNSVLADINGLPVEAHVGRRVEELLPGLPSSMIDEWREVLRTGRAVVGADVVGSTPREPAARRVWKTSSFPVRVSEQTFGLGLVVEDVTEERRIAEERQHALEALGLLSDTSAALSSSLDHAETLARVANVAVPRMADVCIVYFVADDGEVEQLAVAHEDASRADGLRAMHRAAKLDGNLPFGYPKVLRTGETELVSEVTDAMYEQTARDDVHLAHIRNIAAKSWIIAPLERQEQTVGAIAFLYTGERRYSARDVPLVEEIARRATLAIENARLFREAERAALAERRGRDKAEEATRLKDEFLATLSHELRTPLNAILGWARLLQSGSVVEQKKAPAIDTIVRNAMAQSQLIEDLLDVSRIISGKLRLTIEAVNVSEVIASAVDVVTPSADAKGVRIQPVLATDAGLIRGDAGRLQQIVWNLLANAVKFTPRGGRVHVTLRRDESALEIAVADTGAGIASEFLPYVFHRFRQEDGAITRKTGGLGLGLAIVKSLVELHGGTVEASSEGSGLGATFVVRLPIAPVSSAAIVRPERTSALPLEGGVTCPSELAGLKILCIDDEPDARDLLRTLLERCKAIVTTAASPSEALGMLAQARPDVIVSDIGMPGEDGYSFIRKLRSRSREDGGRTPAVALTAYARAEDRTRALVEGFQSHAAKPIDPQELLVVIANLAGRYS